MKSTSHVKEEKTLDLFDSDDYVIAEMPDGLRGVCLREDAPKYGWKIICSYKEWEKR